jgi:hypothetical protein
MKFRFARSARRHKIGKAHAMAAILSGVAPTVEDKPHEGVVRTYLTWVANDDRGVELVIVGRLADEDPDLVIVIHVFPTHLKSL